MQLNSAHRPVVLAAGLALVGVSGCEQASSAPENIQRSLPEPSGRALSALSKGAPGAGARAAAGVASSATVTPVSPTVCASICKHTAALKCGKAPAACEDNCREMLALPACNAEMQSVFACMQQQATERWECDEEGLASVKDGVCDVEQQAFMQCMQNVP